MPIKPLPGHALREGEVVTYMLDAHLEALFETAQLHVDDCVLLVQVYADWLDELQDGVRLVQERGREEHPQAVAQVNQKLVTASFL